MKVVTVLGARPQFIKAATLSRVFKKSDRISETIIHTGQHYDQNMSDIFFEEMQIPRPDHFLQIAAKNHGEMTGRMLEGIEKILLAEIPDLMLVYGDTNSTLAGALAASKIHIPIAHVEAGLRSFNRRMPEEVNRVLTDHLSELLFTPTISSVENLKKEGIDNKKIHLVGDVMCDAILYYQKMSDQRSDIINALNLKGKDFILVTIHRAENTNDTKKMEEILKSLHHLAKNHIVVFPIHPRTRNIIRDSRWLKGIRVIEPVGYLDMISLQKNCRLIVTDSGGVQKEAFLNDKYCITVRDETEWIELVDAGFNYLAQPSSIEGLVEMLWNKNFSAGDFHPDGDGRAADRIAELIMKNKSNFEIKKQ